MGVTVVDWMSRRTFSGKFADIKNGHVILWEDCVSTKKGHARGWGRRLGIFPEANVAVFVDDPVKEIKRLE